MPISTNQDQLPSVAKASLLESTPEASLGYGMIPEVLAPAGGREQFFAALNSGADAVFLGLKKFNARSRAGNFTLEELETLVPLAHRYGMKVLVTLNILIKDKELTEVIRTLGSLERIGVDAVILQDIGLARIAKQYFPGLRLHASTQLAVHNVEGVIAASRAGFSRVVLARELTAEEIKRIRRRTDVELEVFCHGSLCYSYSGLCFFSGAADGRSGNRGECAYTCREPYKVISEPGHGFLFSMRDLDTSKKLNQMIAAGVSALKIEGRKKDAQYVASVVRLYRKKLDELFAKKTLRETAPPMAKAMLVNSEEDIRNDLELSFQRKTTSFFLENRYHENVIDLDHPSHHGVFIGKVEAVTDNLISVRLESDVQKFDGLKVTSSSKLYHSKPQDGHLVSSSLEQLANRYKNLENSFSLRNMWFKGRKIFEATRGMLVDIECASGEHKMTPGDLVFKVRSNELKARIDKITTAPIGERLRPLIPVTTSFTLRNLDDGAAVIEISIVRSTEIIKHVSMTLHHLELRQKGHIQEDLKEVFSVYGDAGAYTDRFCFDLEQNFFLGRSILKETKRELTFGLKKALDDLHDKRISEAIEDVSTDARTFDILSPAAYIIKIDRLEYLPWLTQLSERDLIKEVIFEPKKMFLPGIRPESFLESLAGFQNDTGIDVRLAIPTVMRAWDEPVLKLWFQKALEAGFNKYEVGNIGAFEFIRSHDLPETDITTDFSLYTMNREAAKAWRDMGVLRAAISIEDDFPSISGLLQHWPENIEPVAILYKDTPLFIAEACSLTALHNGCPSSQVCGYRTLEVENSKGERFHVAHEGCKSIVYGDKAYSLSGRRAVLEASGVKLFRIDFLTRPYSEQEFLGVIKQVFHDTPISQTHSANFEGSLK
jgi:U32 family peptidase